MDLDDFFDVTKPMKPIYIPASKVRYNLTEKEMKQTQVVEHKKKGDSYAKDLKERQEEKMKRNERFMVTPMNTSKNSSSSDLEDILDRSFIKSFKSKKNTRALPILKSADEILRSIKTNPVVVIKGDTGCGKSTQVPQMVLDEAKFSNSHCNILVTQPRRIAAVSLANHVANERKVLVGTEVGYQIGLDKKVGEETKIVYCTTGVALQKLVKAKNMNMYTHIIIDEVHERDEDMEFLMIITKLYLTENSPETKIILMSATFDTDEFAEYFKFPLCGKMVKAPTINLMSSRPYQIKEYFLDDLEPYKNRAVFGDEPGIDSSIYSIAVSLVCVFSKWDQNDGLSEHPSILVFLPGIQEIQEMHRLLTDQMARSCLKLTVIMLHSMISSEEQRNVFKHVSEGYCKVILATNIAESSITVPNVGFVIDFCLSRILEADNNTGFSHLRLVWSSKNNLTQRAGRTGRTRDGRVYRLIYKNFYECDLPESEPPALKRCALEKIVLKCKMLNLGLPPYQILGLAINPPDKTDIEDAIAFLKETRGLSFNRNGIYDINDGEMTFMGIIMDALPIDIRASRLIVLGYVFSVLEDCIIMAAGLSVPKVFRMNVTEPLKSYSQRMAFADGSGSDLFAILHAYKFWLRRIHDNRFVSESDRQRAAKLNGLDIKGLNEMHLLTQEIHARLDKFKLVEGEGPNRIIIPDKEKNFILKICIAGAFYPNFFLRKSVTNGDRERKIFHELNGRDPCTTIYYRGIQANKFPIIYQNQIKEKLRDSNVVNSVDDVKVTTDKGSEKIFVTFEGKQEMVERPKVDNSQDVCMPGKVKVEVYKALKLTRENRKIKLNVMNENVFGDHISQIEELCEPIVVDPILAQMCILPIDPYLEEVKGEVCGIVHPNKFWFKPVFDKILTKIVQKMNSDTLSKFKDESERQIGEVVAVFLRSNLEVDTVGAARYYRAKILSINKMIDQATTYRLLLIDDGGEVVATENKMRSLKNLFISTAELGLPCNIRNILVQTIPPRTFECTLAETQPSYIMSTAGKWTKEATDKFKEYCTGYTLTVAKIYSVWNGVASVILMDSQHNDVKNSANKKLIQLGFAQRAEESYPSKQDHAMRYRLQKFGTLDNQSSKQYIFQETINYLQTYYRKPLTPFNDKLLNRVVNIRGPYNPLETNVYAVTRNGSNYTASVENSSVNNVILDTDPQEPNERLMIASSISKTAKGLVLRNTTVMPHIPGFATLMATLFSPYVEFHRDSSKTRYSSVICGLGYDEKRNKIRPRLAEHDIIISIDVQLQESDMQLMNKLRYLISALLHIMPGEMSPNLSLDKKTIMKKEIKQNLINLLTRNRNIVDIRTSEDDYEWGVIQVEDLMECVDVYEDTAIFPMFKFLKLIPEEERHIATFRDNNQELYAVAFANASTSNHKALHCNLCDKDFENVPDLQVHLFTKLHCDRVEQCHARFQIEQYRVPKTQCEKLRERFPHILDSSADE